MIIFVFYFSIHKFNSKQYEDEVVETKETGYIEHIYMWNFLFIFLLKFRLAYIV